MNKKLWVAGLATTMALTVGAFAFSQDFALAEEVTTQSQLKSSLTMALSSKYVHVSSFSEGFATVKDAQGNCGLIDAQGNEVIPISSRYGYISAANGGVVTFYSKEVAEYKESDYNGLFSGYCGYMDTSGKEFYTFSISSDNAYELHENFQNGYGFYKSSEFGMTESGSYYGRDVVYIIDRNGSKKELTLGAWVSQGHFSEEGLMWAPYWDEKTEKTLYHFITPQDTQAFPQTFYDMAYNGFQDGLCGVMNEDGKWGYIDATGKLVIPYQFDVFWNFSGGLGAFRADNGKVGYMDKTGATVIAPAFDGAYGFQNGLASVVKDGNLGVIDETGATIVDFKYQATLHAIDGYTSLGQGEWLYDEYNNSQGFDGTFSLFDSKGKEVIPSVFEELSVIEGTGNYAGKFNGRYYIGPIDNFTLPESGTTPEPEEPDTEPEEPDTEPEEPDVEPEEPDTEPEEPDVKPEEPDVKPEEPDTEPEIPPVQPEIPPVEPEVPDVNPEYIYHKAVPSTSKVHLNGVYTPFKAYEIAGFNYYKLTDLSYALNGTKNQFMVTWDAGKSSINLLLGQPHVYLGGELEGISTYEVDALLSSSPVYRNGQLMNVRGYIIDGSSYFRLDDLKEEIGLTVGWNGETSIISITT